MNSQESNVLVYDIRKLRHAKMKYFYSIFVANALINFRYEGILTIFDPEISSHRHQTRFWKL
jgi:hypothetical protein